MHKEVNVALITRSTPVGFELPPVSNQMRLERWIIREGYQQKGNPGFHGAENIHTDMEMAKKEGLKAPVAGGPLLMSMISHMLLLSFGEGWIKGGKVTMKLIRPVKPDDFVTAKGVVTEISPDGSALRYACDLWIENQLHEKVVVATGSGLVP